MKVYPPLIPFLGTIYKPSSCKEAIEYLKRLSRSGTPNREVVRKLRSRLERYGLCGRVLLATALASGLNRPQEARDVLEEPLMRAKEEARDVEGYISWGHVPNRTILAGMLALAQIYTLLGEYHRSIELLEEILEVNPRDNQGARYTLMMLYLYQDMPKRALRLWREYEDDVSAATRIGHILALIRLGKHEEAEKAVSEMIKHSVYALYFILKEGVSEEYQSLDERGYVELGGLSEAVHWYPQIQEVIRPEDVSFLRQFMEEIVKRFKELEQKGVTSFTFPEEGE